MCASTFPSHPTEPGAVQGAQPGALACTHPHGFTLLELAVAGAIVAVLLTVAVPSVAAFRTQLQLKAATNSLFNSVLFARREAVLRNMRVVVCKSQGGAQCAPGQPGRGGLVACSTATTMPAWTPLSWCCSAKLGHRRSASWATRRSRTTFFTPAWGLAPTYRHPSVGRVAHLQQPAQQQATCWWNCARWSSVRVAAGERRVRWRLRLRLRLLPSA